MECKNPKTAGSSKIAIIAIITALIIGGIYYFKNQSTDEESTTPPSVEVEGPSGLEGFIKKGSLWGWDTAGLDKAEHEIRLRAWKTANNYTDVNMINLPGGELLYMYNGSGKDITAKDVLLSMALGSDSYVILISFGEGGKEQWVMTPGMAQTTIPDAKNPSKIWDITNYATDPGLHKIQAGQGYLLYLHTPLVKDEITKVTGSKSIKAFGANVQRNQDKNSLAETSTALTAGWNMTAFNNVIYKAPHFDKRITNVWEVANDGNHLGPYSIEEVITRNTANMIWFQYGPAPIEPTPTPVEPVYTKATLVIDPRPEVKMDSEIAIIVVDPDVNNADGELVVDKIEIKLKSTPPGDGKPANIKVQATETEANSGKFVAKIKVSADDSSEINLEAGNGYKVKAEYVDTTIPVQADGSTSYTATDIVTVVGEVIEPTEAKVKFFDLKGQEYIDADKFEKNKKEYIFLLVKDPDANTNPNEIEQVNVDLKTSSEKNKTIQLYEFIKETGQFNKNSDLFVATVSFDKGDLEPDNLETGSYIFSEVVVGDKVFAEYSVLPIIQSSNYVTIIEAPVEDGGGDEDKKNTLAEMDDLPRSVQIGDQLKILVKDPDMSGKGKINIKVYSSTDNVGVDIEALKLEDRPGEFEASITVSEVDSSSNPNNLKVSIGDEVTAEYLDTTVPFMAGNIDSMLISKETIVVKGVVAGGTEDTDGDGVTDKEDLCKGENDFKNECNFRAFWDIRNYIEGRQAIEVIVCDFDMFKNSELELHEDISNTITIQVTEKLDGSETKPKEFTLAKVSAIPEGREDFGKYETESHTIIDYPTCYAKWINLGSNHEDKDDDSIMFVKSWTDRSNTIQSFALEMIYVDNYLPTENEINIYNKDSKLMEKMIKWVLPENINKIVKSYISDDARQRIIFAKNTQGSYTLKAEGNAVTLSPEH